MSEYLRAYERTYRQAPNSNLQKPSGSASLLTIIPKLLTKVKRNFFRITDGISLTKTVVWTSFLICGLLISQVEIRGGMLPLALSLLLALKVGNSRYFSPVLLGTIVGMTLTFGFSGVLSTVIPILLYQWWKKSSLVNYSIIGVIAFAMVFFVTEVTSNYYLEREILTVELLQYGIAAILIVMIAILLLPAIKKIESGMSEWQLEKEELVSVIILGTMIFIGLQGLYIGSLSITRIVGLIFVLVLGYYYGAGTGAATGTILGMVIGFYSLSQISVGVLALGGLFAGIFKDFGKIISGFAFLCSASLVIFYLGEPFIIMNYIQEITVTSIIFLIIPHRAYSFLLPKINLKTHDGISNQSSSPDKIINYRINEFAGLFKEMAQIFEQNYFEEKTGETEMENFVYIVVERVCGGCSKMNHCWDNNFFDTYRHFLTALSQFDNIDDLRKQELPSYLIETCIRSSLLMENFQEVLEERPSKKSEQMKEREETKKLLSEQLRGISELLHQMSLYKPVNNGPDEEMQSIVAKAVAKGGYICEEVRVTGGDNEDLTIELMLTNHPHSEKIDISNLIFHITQATGRKLAIAKEELCRDKYDYINGKYFVRLTTERQLTIDSGKVQLNKLGENRSGDNCISKELSTGDHLLLLSDGMGSGLQASKESNAAVSLITKLLDYGFDKKMVINAANSLLSVVNRVDSFATVDMALIDLYTGIGEFCKAGAVSSFIRTSGGIEKVDAGSLPAGIIESVEPKYITYNLKSGDYLIMVSDGVYEVGQDEKWLQDLIAELPPLHPQKMAEKIIEKVQRRHQYSKSSDDVTVLVSKITSKTAEEMLG